MDTILVGLAILGLVLLGGLVVTAVIKGLFFRKPHQSRLKDEDLPQ